MIYNNSQNLVLVRDEFYTLHNFPMNHACVATFNNHLFEYVVYLN